MLNIDPWDWMLHQYVDDGGRVNYQSWKSESAVKLQNWLNDLSAINLQDYCDSNQRLAFWLNLYNALVISQVLNAYPIVSIRPQILGFPHWIAFFRFFSRSIYSFGSRNLSLNDIEHGILRSEFQDPRIHFALVCAAVGCPSLRNEAYRSELVEVQLDRDTVQFMNNPEKVRFDASAQMLYCSKIFKWYRKDFLKKNTSIPAYVNSYLDSKLPITDSTPIRYLDYDWSLNQRMSS
jgi:Protein of unknown function, DUF547